MTPDTFTYLCQPDGGKSCGACCGLYNYADSTCDALTRRLRSRTAFFRRRVKSRDDLPAFCRAIERSEDPTKRYDVIYCCEYLGFLGEDEKRVGCLLHPRQNGGIDLRDVSFYGRELCEGHFCPSYHYISRAEKESLIRIIDDWYLYGLCVTDIDLVKAYFRLISEGVGEMPAPARFSSGPLKDNARRFFSLKTTWPFRSPDINRLGKYYFDGSQYMIHHIDYDALGCNRSRFDQIFLSLSSVFGSRKELKEAEALIQSQIDAFVQTYTALFG